MIAARFMDIINPLDMSWMARYEPEEFENTRIPTWSIRADYAIAQRFMCLQELSLEGFVILGDVLPTQWADFGAPLNGFSPNLGLPPQFRIIDTDERGETEYGLRLGGMIGGVHFTLNYLYLYNDDFSLKAAGFLFEPGNPLPFILTHKDFPSIDVYGLTFNYFWGGKINTVISFEGTWTPNQPYTDAEASLPAIRDKGTFRYSLRLSRLTFVLPRPTSAMDISVQFSQTLREGNMDKVYGPAQQKVDTNNETVTFQLRQPLWHHDIQLIALLVYDLDDAHLFKPSIRYSYGDHWYFDLFVVAVGGGERRIGRFGSMTWQDMVVSRVTLQF
jgi:hypothetical protein